MNGLALALGAAAALVGAAPAAAEKPAVDAAEEARVPFLHIGRMRTFRAIDDETVYVQAQRRQWYRVLTMGPCPNLPWARFIGVDTRGSAMFDRFSTLIVDGERCAVSSVVRSGEPPRRERRR
ncbi:MAG TPA: DUF6491 family protein [Allosphingosinicella sp.]|nr:DUF6491 family protein [Allosphingosinicella sp.]